MTKNRRLLFAASKQWLPNMEQTLKEAFSECEIMLVSTSVELKAELEHFTPAYVFFFHWSSIIPASIYEAYDCVIFHMTDVPFGRGGSPLQNLIVRGFDETKISALKCVKDLDAGPVYLKVPLSLVGNAEAIYTRANWLMLDMVREIVSKQLQPKPQQGEPVIFKRRRPEQSNITEVSSLASVYDHIRMLDATGYPHAFLETESLQFEFTDAQLQEGIVEAKVKIRLKEQVE